MDEYKELIMEYIKENPLLPDPSDNMYLTGLQGMINLLKIAKNKPITFEFKEGSLDYFIAKIDDKQIDSADFM